MKKWKLILTVKSQKCFTESIRLTQNHFKTLFEYEGKLGFCFNFCLLVVHEKIQGWRGGEWTAKFEKIETCITVTKENDRSLVLIEDHQILVKDKYSLFIDF